MKRHLVRATQRLVMAGAFSGLGFVATKYWYDSVRPKKSNTNATGIGHLVSSWNEVQTRRAGRTIWQGAQSQVDLKSGDSIRTGPNGGARIEFDHLKSIIELDPDSLIEIKNRDGKISIELAKGSLFVTAISDEHPLIITLKDQKQEILSGSASLRVGKAGELVRTDYNKNGPYQSGGFEIRAPQPNTRAFVDSAVSRPFDFSWSPLTTASEVKLEIGSSPSRLSEAVTLTSTQFPDTVSTLLGNGVHYWRLVAYAKDESGLPSLQPLFVSEIMKLEVRPKTAPVQIYPLNQSKISRGPNDSSAVTFRWSNPASSSNLRFELAKVIGAKSTIIHSQNLSGRESQYGFVVPDAGVYLWRISGVDKDNKMTLQGVFTPFQVVQAKQVPAPTLLSPVDHDKLAAQTLKESGLFLSWSASESAESYKITLQSSKGVSTREAQNNSLKLTDLDPGDYRWFVQVVNPDQSLSQPSEKANFRID